MSVMKEGWTYKKLGEVCVSITDGSHNPPKGIDYSDYRMISSQNVFDNQLVINDDVRYLTEEDYQRENNRTRLTKDVVLLTIVGTIGRSCVLQGNEGYLTLQRSVAALHPSSDIVSRYLMHCLIGKRNTLDQEAHGIAQKGIYLKQLSTLVIPIPPLPIQQSIVSELDKINELIALKKSQLKDLDTLAQSIFYDMFGDPITNEKGWEMKKYSDCFTIGSGGTPSKSVPEYWDNGSIPWIGSNMCQNSVITETDGKFITEEGLKHSSAKMLEEGTVLVALVGATIGKVALLRTKTSTNQNIAFIKVNETKEFVSEYVFFHLMNQYDEFMLIGNGDFKMASQAFIKDLNIMVPPLSLQHQFAERVESIERLKQQVQTAIKDLETLLASRMQYWFD